MSFTATGALFARSVRQIPRVPADVVQALVIPVFLFALNAAQYSAVSRLPGFPAQDYAAFLLPQIMVWTVFMSGNGAAYALVLEVKTGYLDKLILTPTARSAILSGRFLAVALRAALQVLLIVAIGYAVGIRFATGIAGLLLALVPLALLAIAWAGFGAWLALVTRSPEAVEASIVLFIPLTFLTTGAMPLELMPEGFRPFVLANPVTYIVEGVRSLLMGWDAGAYGLAVGAAGAMALVTVSAATWALRRMDA